MTSISDNINIIISLLKIIDSDNLISIKLSEYEYTHPLVNAVKYLANEYLINKDGYPDRYNIDIISLSGFQIFPKEHDRFGWLSGYIELSRGIITFG